MILSEAEILKLVLAPEDPVLKTNRDLQDDHKVHIQGTGFENVLHEIIGYESTEQFAQKKLLTKPFTRPLFKKIINAQSRWKTAWGTSKFYHFTKKNETAAKNFKTDVLSQVWKGSSMDNFIKEFFSLALYQEFNGFFLVEKGQVKLQDDGTKHEVREGIARLIKQGEALKPYIIFISAKDVYQFKLTGKNVEFLVLRFGTKARKNEGDKPIELFRVIDDKFDYIVEKEDGKVRISEEFPKLEHKAGRCPASCVTYINKTLTDDRTKTSPVDDIIDILDYHLHQFAEHLVTEILHAHPNFYQVGNRCMEVSPEGIKCDAGQITGEWNGAKIDYVCKACKGTGHNLKKDASTVTILPAKDDTGAAFSIANVMGYVTPPVETLTYQQNAIDWMEERILSAALGLNNVRHSEKLEKTATEAVINLKPLEDIISEIIDIIESVETNLTNIIGKMYYGDKFKGSEIIYGRKLSLRDENTLLNEIKESKEAGSSKSHVKSLNEELTYSRFIRSNLDLQRNIILNELEPLIGFTYDEVEKSVNIPKEVKVLKQNFVDVIQLFEAENGNIVDFMPGSEMGPKVVKLKEKLKTYVDKIMDGIGGEGTDEEDITGKIPLALQQMALSITRAKEAGDEALAAKLTEKMNELLKSFTV